MKWSRHCLYESLSTNCWCENWVFGLRARTIKEARETRTREEGKSSAGKLPRKSCCTNGASDYTGIALEVVFQSRNGIMESLPLWKKESQAARSNRHFLLKPFLSLFIKFDLFGLRRSTNGSRKECAWNEFLGIGHSFGKMDYHRAGLEITLCQRREGSRWIWKIWEISFHFSSLCGLQLDLRAKDLGPKQTTCASWRIASQEWNSML